MKRIINTIIFLIVTLFLLELISFLILQAHRSPISNKENNNLPLDIFKFQKKGEIISNQKAVLPCKENFQSSWSNREFSVRVKTNNLGLRSERKTDLQKTDVAFFGDSFTFGHGVEKEERFSEIVEKKINPKIKSDNFSYINGYQPEHYEYYLRNNTNLSPNVTIIGLYLGNDLCSDIKDTYYNRDSNHLRILSRRISPEGAMINNRNFYKFPINHLIKRSYFTKLLVMNLNKGGLRHLIFRNHIPNSPNNELLEKGKEDLSQNRAIQSLVEIKKILHRRNGSLVVLIIPQNYFFKKCSNPHISQKLVPEIKKLVNGQNNILNNVCSHLKEIDIDYINPVNILKSEMYFKLDAHWNPLGHNVVGTEIAKKINHILNKQSLRDSTVIVKHI
jgi:hypothetical protein